MFWYKGHIMETDISCSTISAGRQYPAYRQHSETGKHLLYLEDTSSQNACPALLGRTYIMVGWVLCGQHWRRFDRNNSSVYRQPGVNKNAPKGATFPYEIDERHYSVLWTAIAVIVLIILMAYNASKYAGDDIAENVSFESEEVQSTAGAGDSIAE